MAADLIHYAQADETQDSYGQTATLCGRIVSTEDIWDLGKLFSIMDRPECAECRQELLYKHAPHTRP